MSARRSEEPAIQFLGATGTVTGSRFLVDTPNARVLIDCGLYQGPKQLRLRNWDPLPVDPESIDAVLLSHAHVDHSGYLPALSRQGFGSPVLTTRRTADLCRIVLPDAAKLQEEEAAWANRKGFSKHRPALALYDHEDAEAVLARFRPVPFDQSVEVAEGIRAVFRPAGHILGSASIRVELDGERKSSIVFSGDLGRPYHPLLVPPAPMPAADVLLIESTYGSRTHPADPGLEAFADAVCRTADRGGVAVIPAFAVDRTEVVLFHAKRLIAAGRIPDLPIFVDSPMALSALDVYRAAIDDGDPEIRPELRGAPDPFDSGRLIEARSTDASKAINEQRGPAIIISASGMATGGRVVHHLAKRLPDARNSVLLVGFQAQMTRGRMLLDGARQVKMLGKYVPVRAETVDLTEFSVHADRSELLAWMRGAPGEPETTFVVHGEPDEARSLRDAIEAELGWSAVVPSYLERVRAGRRS